MNVIRVLEHYHWEGANFIVTELCTGGDLKNWALDNKAIMTEHLWANITSQIAAGLNHCHKLGMVHRDLKPDNILILRKEGPPVIKIIDFGLANLSEDGLFISGNIGNQATRAPEIWAAGYGRVSYSAKSDMWSLGVILFELLVGLSPFADETNRDYE